MTRPLRALTPFVLTCIATVGLATACDDGGSGGDDIEFAEATFKLSDASDCVEAFDGTYLNRLAEEREWDEDDINAFCVELADIADTYADSSTLTTMTLAGVGQLDGESLETGYYVGVAGYDLTAIRDWSEQARSARAVRQCIRAAGSELRNEGVLPEDFVSDCLEDETGQAYPEPLFRETRSEMGLDDVGDAGAGLATSLAIFNVPGEGTVVAFLGGAFYAQADPAYGAFVGCGAAIGFDRVEEDVVGSALCMAAEYSE